MYVISTMQSPVFQGLFYFKKVQRFGDVPWYDKVLDSSDAELLYKPRDSREFVMQKIIEDLDLLLLLYPKIKNFTESVNGLHWH